MLQVKTIKILIRNKKKKEENATKLFINLQKNSNNFHSNVSNSNLKSDIGMKTASVLTNFSAL